MRSAMDHERVSTGQTRTNILQSKWHLNQPAKRRSMAILSKLIQSQRRLLKAAAKTLIWQQHQEMDAKKLTGAKDDEGITQKALAFLAERQYARLCALMFILHKTNAKQWVTNREALLRHAVNHHQLSSLATILECSVKDELSACYVHLPGLKELADNLGN